MHLKFGIMLYKTLGLSAPARRSRVAAFSAKPGKVVECKSGQGKVGEKAQSRETENL